MDKRELRFYPNKILVDGNKIISPTFNHEGGAKAEYAVKCRIDDGCCAFSTLIYFLRFTTCFGISYSFNLEQSRIQQ